MKAGMGFVENFCKKTENSICKLGRFIVNLQSVRSILKPNESCNYYG